MRPGDPIYQKQLEIIGEIPSNKFDAVDLSGLTDREMAAYDSQHERDLRAQIRAFDDEDKRIVVDEILNCGWTHVYNVLGDYIGRLYTQIENIKKTTNQE